MFLDGHVGGDVEHRKLLDDPYRSVARRGAFPDGPVRPAQLDGALMVAQPPIRDQARMEQALARRGVRPRISPPVDLLSAITRPARRRILAAFGFCVR
ncbi:hypothetical protein GCM10010191_67300 [Actinomadura vinacea]|uniref:Uncharacterized protein n=1 Tax=Actinomadura vinacea TaxID=115336 RepID=A0ABN3JYQ7_9ACTN